jgi:hypothetical protein
MAATFTLEIPPEIERELVGEARNRGIAVTVLAVRCSKRLSIGL